MRALLVTWAWPSHLYAMVPLAWALRAEGHEVRVAAPPALYGEIAAAGLSPVPVGPDLAVAESFRAFAGRGPAFARPAPAPARPAPAPDAGAPRAAGPDAGPPRAASPGGGPATGPGSGAARPGGGVPRALRVFADLAKAMAGDLLEFAREWRPELVVYDPTAWAGALAAAAAGALPVRHTYGLDLLARARQPVAELVAPVCRRYGLPPVDPAAAVTVDPVPDELQLPVPGDRLPLRHLPFHGARPGRALPAGDDRRRICVTWGTTMARIDPGYFLAGEVLAAVAPLAARAVEGGSAVEVVAAVTGAQRGLLEPVPPGVRVVTDAPLHLQLSGCAAVIAHGGAGTMLAALSRGVPMLAVPQLPDHAAHADRMAASGAGLVVARHEELTPERIRAAVTELLDDPSYRAAAARIAERMADRPSPSCVARDLVSLARDRSTTLTERR